MLCVDAWRLILSFDDDRGRWTGSSTLLVCRAAHTASLWAATRTAAGRAATRRALVRGRAPPVDVDEVLRDHMADAERALAFDAGIDRAALFFDAKSVWACLNAARDLRLDAVRAALEPAEAEAVIEYAASPLTVSAGWPDSVLEAIALHLDDVRALRTLLDRGWAGSDRVHRALMTRRRCATHMATHHPDAAIAWDNAYFCLSLMDARDAAAMIRRIDSPFALFAAAQNPDPEVLCAAERRHLTFAHNCAMDVVRCAVHAENDSWPEVFERYTSRLSHDDCGVIMNEVLRLRGDMDFIVGAELFPHSWTPETFWHRRPRGQEPPDCAVTLQWAVRGATEKRPLVPARAFALLALVPDAVPIAEDVRDLMAQQAADGEAVLDALRAGHHGRAEWIAGRCAAQPPPPRDLVSAALKSGSLETVRWAVRTARLPFRDVSDLVDARTPPALVDALVVTAGLL